MSPLFLFALFAGLGGYSIHRRWWGAAAFSGAMMLWMVVIQICIAISMQSHLN